MKLVAGLGNPGAEYAFTPHNAGFWAIEQLASSLQVSISQQKFQAQIGKTCYQEESVLLMKPLTLMNLSGNAVAACARFYQLLPEDILIISDDLDLPVGKARLRKTGSHGGHNGLRSVSQQLGSSQFKRLRLGIGRSTASLSAKEYVLRRWSSEQIQLCVQLIEQAMPLILDFLGSSRFQNTSLSI